MHFPKTIILTIAFILSGFFYCQAQVSSYSSQTGIYSFDGGIRQIRENAMPGFSVKYDDYLQYSPGIVMLGMKAFGYESRTCWGRMLVSDAFSAALMTGLVNGLKYTVKRTRPDGSSANSFPSGHTATAFMLATMMHKEYGWKSPWFSFGAYTAASATAIGRIMNDRHWAGDIIGGAIIGIAATHLGYFITDKIFRNKYLSKGYTNPEFSYDPTLEYFDLDLYFGYRFFPGYRKKTGLRPKAGGSIGLHAEIPVNAGDGVCLRTSANSMTFTSGKSLNMYNFAAGGFWHWSFARIMAFETRLMIGYAWHKEGNGINLIAGPALSVVTGNNFKLKLFAEYETFSFNDEKSMLHTIQTGLGASFFW